MALSITNFLLSLASAMAASVAPTTPSVAIGSTLFVNDAPESQAAACYAVLRPYGGPPPEELWRIDNVSIQLAAFAKAATPAIALAWQLYESLHQSPDGVGSVTPRYDWSIPGKMIDPASGATVDDTSTTYMVFLIVLSAPPGLVGVDIRGMRQVSFNFDARFAAVPTS